MSLHLRELFAFLVLFLFRLKLQNSERQTTKIAELEKQLAEEALSR
jgi:hypothetical protein